MRSRNRRWLFTWILCLSLLELFECEAIDRVEGRNTTYTKNGTSVKETRGLFAPRMDYEQWKPLGRGDPLKNDPTYDYVPPVLETVRYWRDTSSRKQDQTPPNQPQKKEVLILGVSSKKPSTGTSVPDNNRREYFEPFLKYVKEPQYNYQRHRPHNPITSPYFTPSYFLNKLTERPMINNINNDGPVPYTMLVPPPMPSKQSTSTYSMYPTTVTKPPSSTGVTIDQANLIFQSSSSVLNDWDSTSVDSSNLVTWKTPISPEPIMSNIIDGRHDMKPDSFIQIDYSEPINITHTEEELMHEEQISSPSIMHKGQVADGVMDLANTYVNIGISQAQMDSSSGIGISGISVKPPNLAEMPPIVMKGPGQLMEPMVINPMFTPKKPTMMMETMQTMQPPPISIRERPSYGTLQSLLQKESTKSVSMSTLYVTTTSTTPLPTTTTTSSLTTDPLFKHYKQPMEPIRGPMYLIIQGHSKVKTYGPAKQIHGISVQEMNEIPNSDETGQYSVKHLHNYEKIEDRKRSGRSSNLQTLSHVVQTGLGAIDFADDVTNRRNDDFQETVLKAGYKVSGRKENASEKYYKGIVEAGDLARKLHNSAST